MDELRLQDLIVHMLSPRDLSRHCFTDAASEESLQVSSDSQSSQ